MADWLPRREQDFNELCEYWAQALMDTAKMNAFAWDAAECTRVAGIITSYTAAWHEYHSADTSANRLAKDELKAQAEEAMRDFAHTGIRHNKRMTDAERLPFGIRPGDGTPSPDTEPVSWPEAEGDTATPRQVGIHYWDNVTKKRGKPHHIHGAEIRWAVLAQPPAHIDELIHSSFDTASPFTLKFDEADRGKRVYFCLRWESTTNLKGPFWEIYSAIIP